MQFVLYIASIVGALVVLMMMPKRRLNLPRVGAVVGAALLGFLWLFLANADADRPGEGPWAWVGPHVSMVAYYYVFSAIAIGAAVRVITHTRPVYSALWFVLVIIASAGLFLCLAAEFMAFAMVIIYAGAILVTYMFVIMLATQSEDPDFAGPDDAGYDRVAREPVAAVAAGFLLLAVLLTVVFDRMEPNLAAAAPSDRVVLTTILEDRAAARVRAMASPIEVDEAEDALAVRNPAETTAGAEAFDVSNVERVGLDLFMSHALGLELAGVVLLVSLIGAVVIARTRVEGEEDGSVVPDAVTGATVDPDHEAGPHEPEAIGRIGGRMGGRG